MYDFHNTQHVADYLTGCIVKKSGRPVYVAGVYDPEPSATGDDIKVQINELPGLRASKTVRVGLLSFDPLPLGMCNLLDKTGTPVEAAYIVRVPARRWKIGLSRYGLHPFPSRQPANRYDWHPWLSHDSNSGPEFAHSWLTMEPGYNMLTKDYPSFQHAKTYMEPFEMRSCAFSPNFSITATDQLMYRFHNVPVGKALNSPVLYDKYKALAEVLEEDYGK